MKQFIFGRLQPREIENRTRGSLQAKPSTVSEHKNTQIDVIWIRYII